ncbi:MAG TPA: acyltransferase family protein, partial [Terracidiphilus sp.]|nr:acyltransferase family protein [Terracidiphilus sp.]
MNASNPKTAPRGAGPAETSRIDYLDATRALALLLGVLFHASLSFSPVFSGWAVQDVSTGPLIPMFVTVSHSFRMETFFLMAAFFSHLVFHRKGAGEFVRTRTIRIAVPFIAGWFLLRPLLVSGWIMGAESLRGKFHFWAGIEQAFGMLRSLPAGIFTGTHLWFLYYLAIITALTLVLRGLLTLTGPWYRAVANAADKLVAWLAQSRYALPALAGPTAGALWFMQYWGMDTPDQSLRWNLPVLAVYGGSFALGWMLDRQRDAIVTFSRLTLARVIVAGMSMAAAIWLSGVQTDPAHDHYTAAHIGFAVSYAAMMWTLVPLTIGVCRKLC